MKTETSDNKDDKKQLSNC